MENKKKETRSDFHKDFNNMFIMTYIIFALVFGSMIFIYFYLFNLIIQEEKALEQCELRVGCDQFSCKAKAVTHRTNQIKYLVEEQNCIMKEALESDGKRLPNNLP